VRSDTSGQSGAGEWRSEQRCDLDQGLRVQSCPAEREQRGDRDLDDDDSTTHTVMSGIPGTPSGQFAEGGRAGELSC
jgi:hypothetical protein